MNIIYIPGGPEASAAETPDMREYVRRGTQINMASHKIVNCAPGTDDDDVVTLRGLSAYYRKGLPLDMNQRQIKNLVDATEPTDAVTLRQVQSLLADATEPIGAPSFIHIDPANTAGVVRLHPRAALVPKTKNGIVRRNRFGTAILLKCNSAIPLALYVRTLSGAYVQQPLSVVERPPNYTPIQERLTPTLVLFTTRETALEGEPYIFHYLVNEATFVEREPSDNERATLNPG